MADILKYVSLANLQKYDEKIKEHIATADATLKTNLEGQIEVVANALDGEISRAKAAEQTNATAAQAAQTAADNLATYVGTFTASDGVDTVVKYIDAKTANIASDATVNALGERVTQAEKDIDAIEADYLKAADAEALQTSIDGVVEDVAEIAGDYLKAADKTELEGKINAKADTTALDAEVSARETAVSGLQTQINTIMNNPDAEGAINSINEFTQYVADHGTIADGFRTDINKNKDDIAAMDNAAKLLAMAIQGRLDNLEAIDHDAYKAADTALKNELNTEIGKKANSADVTASVQTLEAADEKLSGRLDDVEAALGTGEGSVNAQIATSKQEAIDAAAADATAKANKALEDAKTYANGLNTSMDERMDVVEAKAHEHSNKALLDTYTQTEVNLADAVAKKHAHSNLEVLEGITSAKISTWDTVTTMATSAALNAEVSRAEAKEAELQAAIDAIQECTQAEIDALFA